MNLYNFKNVIGNEFVQGISIAVLILAAVLIVNLAVKQLGSGSYTWGSTNATGYMILGFCNPVGTIVTYQATDYGFQLEPNKIVEAIL